MSIRVSRTVTITLPGTTVLNGDLIDRLSELPRDATVSIDYTDFSGSRDPREHSYVILTVTSR